MSQPDLVRALQGAKLTAPDELRERVRLMAAQAPPREPSRWRRALVITVPVVAAAAVATVVLYPRGHQEATPPVPTPFPLETRAGAAPKAAFANGTAAAAHSTVALPAPNSTRLQKYDASLSLQVKNTKAVSDATKAAVAIAHSLGGYQQSVNVSADTGTGFASIELKVPKSHVTEAVRRMSALGTILSENVSVQDLQGGYNANTRLIASLQRRLATFRAQPQTARTERQIDALTTRIENLQRQQAATVRAAHYATVDLQLTTKAPVQKHHHPGPLHGLGVAFRWLGIGLVYVVALGAPIAIVGVLVWLAVRTLRRRREERLLSQA
jgi:Domain of unknown function (DUF4349)